MSNDIHTRFQRLWGIVSPSPADIILEAPRDAADGIGSALAVSDAELLAEGPVRIFWELVERRGGDEDWRGFWLMFLPPRSHDMPQYYYPMSYYRPTTRGFEIGEAMGGAPEDQHIWATWVGADEDESHGPAHVGFADGAIHVASTMRGTISLPIGPRLLGLYCEGSTVRVRVERG